jgi:MIP family channel proteins
MWEKFLAEFVGTFTLVFIGCGVAALTYQATRPKAGTDGFGEKNASLIATAIAFGVALMVIVYMWASISGAHVNPAVSLGFALTDQMSYGTMGYYWIAQVLGAIAGAALLAYLIGTESGLGASVGSLTNTFPWKAVIVETIITFLLVSAIFAVTSNSSYAIVAGLVIGIALLMGVIFAGPLTGGSANPARTLGPALFTKNMGSFWIYLIGPFLGAILAALLYAGLHNKRLNLGF